MWFQRGKTKNKKGRVVKNNTDKTFIWQSEGETCRISPVFRGDFTSQCHWLPTGRPWSNNRVLLPVRAHYVSPFGGLSSVYEPRESAAISNLQSRAETMAPTILVEYLIEYHSSVLIKLDGRGQQSERPAQSLFFLKLSLRNNKRSLHQNIYMKPPQRQRVGESLWQNKSKQTL